MSSEPANDLISILVNNNIEAIALKDGTYVKVREVTSVNQTKETVRVIPRQGSALVIPFGEISEIIEV